LEEALDGCDAVKGRADKDGFEGIVLEDKGNALDLVHNEDDDSTQFEV
jgi:hypothetical protein